VASPERAGMTCGEIGVWFWKESKLRRGCTFDQVGVNIRNETYSLDIQSICGL